MGAAVDGREARAVSARASGVRPAIEKSLAAKSAIYSHRSLLRRSIYEKPQGKLAVVAPSVRKTRISANFNNRLNGTLDNVDKIWC